MAASATATRAKARRADVEIIDPPGTGINPQAVYPGLPNLHAEWVEITPSLAAQFLELNDKNRTQRQRRVDTIVADILGDDWEPNGATIVFSPTGIMLDGQHRCSAIAATDKGVVTLVAWGIYEEARQVIDAGAARTVADWLQMEEGLRNAVTASAIAKRWNGWLTLPVEERYLVPNWKPSQRAIIHTFQQDGPVIVQATQYAVWAKNQAGKSMKKVTLSIWGFAYIVMLTAMMGDRATTQIKQGKPLTPNDDDVKNVKYFLDRVAKGEGLKRGDPEMAFRDRVQNAAGSNESLPERDVLFLLFGAWIAWRSRRETFKLSKPKTGVNAANFPNELY